MDWKKASGSGEVVKIPIGSHGIISAVMDRVRDLNPRIILDVGIGFGKWGFLCREYLEVIEGRYNKGDWQTTLDGVEIWEPYINGIHKEIYDRIIIEDIRKFQFDRNYDLVIIADVLEHLDSEQECHDVLKRCLEYSPVLIVTTPYGKQEREPVYGNNHEEHKLGLLPEFFKDYRKDIHLVRGIMIVTIWRDSHG